MELRSGADIGRVGDRAASLFDSAPKYTRLMAMEYVVQRLEMGDVVLIDLPEQGGEVEAKVVEPIDRTKTTVRVSLRVAGREDFVQGVPLGEKVTVVRGLSNRRSTDDTEGAGGPFLDPKIPSKVGSKSAPCPASDRSCGADRRFDSPRSWPWRTGTAVGATRCHHPRGVAREDGAGCTSCPRFG